MRKLALSAALWAAILITGISSQKAEAGIWVSRPWFRQVVVGGTVLGWGHVPWVQGVGVTVGHPAYYYMPYGYSYFPFWGYQPRYSSFAAISYSQQTGNFGWSHSNATRQQALDWSNRYCGQEDCRPVVWVQGGCAVVAKSQETGRLGYAYHANRYPAQQYALRACRSQGAEDCQTAAWVCSY